MASQKRNRSTSRQGKSGGSATRPGPGTSSNRGGTQQADRGQNGRGQNGRGQNGRAQNGRAQATRTQNGLPEDGRAQNGRAQNGRTQNGRAGQGRSSVAQAQRRAGALTAGSAGSKAGIPFSAPAWVQWTALGLSLAGLGVSIYMTIAHYTSTAILVCSNNGYIDCAKVTTSPESMIFNIFPVAVLGLAFYVFMVAINTPWAWRSGIAAIWWARLAGIITGMGFVLYLIYAEVIQIGNLCLDCTTVHIITFLLFGLLIFAATLRSTTPADTR
jgi:uncharacterized membrane protein